jgi:hypothetical protein
MVFLLSSAIAAILPGSARLPGAAELGLAAFVTKFLRETTWLMWLAAVGSAAAFMLTPILTVWVPRPAFLLPARLLDRHVAAMADHRVYPVRQAAFLLKMIGGLHWAAHPEVRSRLGLLPYPPDPGTWRTS